MINSLNTKSSMDWLALVIKVIIYPKIIVMKEETSWDKIKG
jgi:hypothetical protein